MVREHKPCPHIEKLPQVLELRAQGLSCASIAKSVGMAPSRVWYFLNPERCPFVKLRREVMAAMDRLKSTEGQQATREGSRQGGSSLWMPVDARRKNR